MRYGNLDMCVCARVCVHECLGPNIAKPVGDKGLVPKRQSVVLALTDDGRAFQAWVSTTGKDYPNLYPILDSGVHSIGWQLVISIHYVHNV